MSTTIITKFESTFYRQYHLSGSVNNGSTTKLNVNDTIYLLNCNCSYSYELDVRSELEVGLKLLKSSSNTMLKVTVKEYWFYGTSISRSTTNNKAKLSPPLRLVSAPPLRLVSAPPVSASALLFSLNLSFSLGSFLIFCFHSSNTDFNQLSLQSCHFSLYKLYQIVT